MGGKLKRLHGGSWRTGSWFGNLANALSADYARNRDDDMGFRLVAEEQEQVEPETGPLRALHGGSWRYGPATTSANRRSADYARSSDDEMGFRLVAEEVNYED